MKIAIFGKNLAQDYKSVMTDLVDTLYRNNISVSVYKPFWQYASDCFGGRTPLLFENHSDLKADMIFSIGGDGTLLGALPLVRDSNIPILGINTGRMGFLSSVSRTETNEVVAKIIKGQYKTERRTLIELVEPQNVFADINYALNEVGVFHKNNGNLIVICVYVNDLLVNKYWADGLVVATPTGSTAYSLSAGGPIMTPDSGAFVITPVATHNLSVRPVVIPDNSTVRISIQGRTEGFMLSMDSRSAVFDADTEILIRKADVALNTVRMEGKDFFGTIREKLLWGTDIRN